MQEENIKISYMPLRLFFPEPHSKAEEKILEQEAILEVSHAVNSYLYEHE